MSDVQGLVCEHVGVTSTFSGGTGAGQSGRVQWCSSCGAIRFEKHIDGVWVWCRWEMPKKGRQSPIQRQVIEFHRAFDHPIALSPGVPPDARVRFRASLISEEVFEFFEACFDPTSPGGPGVVSDRQVSAGAQLAVARAVIERLITYATISVDLSAAVDALADTDYVVEGTRLDFGVDGDPIAREVHRSNMAKMARCDQCDGVGHNQVGHKCPYCGGKGRILLKREDGKVRKPANWTPPDIAGEIAKQQADSVAHGLAGKMGLCRCGRPASDRYTVLVCMRCGLPEPEGVRK